MQFQSLTAVFFVGGDATAEQFAAAGSNGDDALTSLRADAGLGAEIRGPTRENITGFLHDVAGLVVGAVQIVLHVEQVTRVLIVEQGAQFRIVVRRRDIRRRLRAVAERLGARHGAHGAAKNEDRRRADHRSATKPVRWLMA